MKNDLNPIKNGGIRLTRARGCAMMGSSSSCVHTLLHARVDASLPTNLVADPETGSADVLFTALWALRPPLSVSSFFVHFIVTQGSGCFWSDFWLSQWEVHRGASASGHSRPSTQRSASMRALPHHVGTLVQTVYWSLSKMVFLKCRSPKYWVKNEY